MYEVTPDIVALEKQIQSEPESLFLYEQLLWKYFEEETLVGHPRRIDHILWYIHRFPRKSICRSPFVQVDPGISPEGFQIIEGEWLRHLADNPGDADVARGAANFLCVSDIGRAKEILCNVIDNDPNQSEVWMDLGRLSLDPHDRLRYFQEARQRGSTQPNLLAWISSAAIEVGDFILAEVIGLELLALVDAARVEYGDKLDWKEKRDAIWTKALDAMGDEADATRLVRAISDNAYHKHWGHIALGHVALHQDDLTTALDHLRESGDVVCDPRLSSYGPSFTLAKELCMRGEWFAVAEYLRACESFWDDERLPVWRTMVQSHKLPDF